MCQTHLSTHDQTWQRLLLPHCSDPFEGHKCVKKKKSGVKSNKVPEMAFD